MTARDVLAGALAALRTRGWCQNRFEDPDGRLCVVGALRTSAGLPLGTSIPMEDPAWIAYRDALEATKSAAGVPVETPTGTLNAWNDRAGRSFAHIERALTTALSLLP